MAESDQPGVVELVDAGVPADQGLSSLGLLMQLAGHVLAACAVFMFSVSVLAGGVGGSASLWLFIIFMSSCARSMLHVSAGKRILYGDTTTSGRLGGTHRYIAFALVQSAFVAALVRLGLGAPTDYAVAIGAGLAVWPVTLSIVLRLPRFRRFDVALPITEDKGFEGASILMALLGLTGAAATAMLLWIMFMLPSSELQRGPNILVLLAMVMLLVRSLLHAHAGVSGLRTTSLDRSVELANRYANFGVISSFCAGGALLLFAMASGMQVGGLALVCGLCWLLLAWPMILRRFYADRQFADILAGGAAPLHRRAPDAGLTWLGWFLLAYAAWDASLLLPNLFMTKHGDAATVLFALAGAAGSRSLWWSVGLVVVQGWAGFELVRMSRVSKGIATAYGVIAVALTLYLDWPLIEQVRHLGVLGGIRARDVSPDLVLMLGPIAIALIIPIGTIVLVHRNIAPAARARFRDRPASP